MTSSARSTAQWQFHGGLALEPHKAASLARGILPPPLPTILRIPLSTGHGELGDLQVKPGDLVRRGQALTHASRDTQLACHAPTSGKVVEVVDLSPAQTPTGQACRQLLIEPDGQHQSLPPAPLANWRKASSAALVDHLHQMGLVGMGGAMFPTAAKLRGNWPKPETLIVNGAECEPWISCDEALMRSRPQAIVAGSEVLARACGARKIRIAVEADAREAIDGLSLAIESWRSDQVDLDWQLVVVPTLYPQGGERQLIQTLTGQEVPHGQLPQSIGVLCHNVATAAAAHDAVILGLPLTERILTLTGPGLREPCNVLALIGTPFEHLIEFAGGLTDDARRLVLGGPMSGLTLGDPGWPAGKGSNCLLALTDTRPSQPSDALPCINCGACVETCPASLMPQLLFRQLEAGQYEAADRLHLSACIECGVCAEVCPSHLPLVDWYRHGKDVLRERQREKRQAALSQQRFDARSARLEQQAKAREERRQQRQARLTQPQDAQSEILAAIARARSKNKTGSNDP